MAQENFFSLSDLGAGIPRELAEGLSTRIFVGEQAMLSIVTIEPNASGSTHSHPEEQWGYLLKGNGVRTQGDREVPVKAGDFWRTPGGEPHSFKGGSVGATVLDFFAPPREEYKKAGKGFGAG
jgi:quercetin dioxygenase-like cupin family protein